MHAPEAPGATLVAVFSAVVSADELREILAASAGSEAHRHLAPHLHLTRDSLHTLPDLGFAEVVTADAGLADALHFCDVEVVDLAARTKQTLVRLPGGEWQRVGVVSCGAGQALLPQLLKDSDVPAAPKSRALVPGMPCVWQWASAVVEAAAADVAALEMAVAEPQQASAPAPRPVLRPTSSAAAPQAQQQQQHEEAASDINISRTAPVPRVLPGEDDDSPASVAARALSFASADTMARAAWFRQGLKAVMRVASFGSSAAGGAHLQLCQERRATALARVSMSPLRAQLRHQRVEHCSAPSSLAQAAPAPGLPPSVAQVAARIAPRAMQLMSH